MDGGTDRRKDGRTEGRTDGIRELGGAPRNPAPRNHFWRGLSDHQAATARTHLVEKHIVECRLLLGAFPLSLTEGPKDTRTEGRKGARTEGWKDRRAG